MYNFSSKQHVEDQVHTFAAILPISCVSKTMIEQISKRTLTYVHHG